MKATKAIAKQRARLRRQNVRKIDLAAERAMLEALPVIVDAVFKAAKPIGKMRIDTFMRIVADAVTRVARFEKPRRRYREVQRPLLRLVRDNTRPARIQEATS